MTPLKQLAERLRAPAVLVGVGNELRGDDAVGVLAARRLANTLSEEQVSGKLSAVESGPVPESYLGPILQNRPQQVVFCDAVDFGGAPGEWRVFEMDDLSAACVSTHNSSLALLSKVLLAEGVSDVFLLGIQPKQTSFGSPCSREALAAVEEVVAALLAWAVGWGQVEVSMAGQETHQAAD